MKQLLFGLILCSLCAKAQISPNTSPNKEYFEELDAQYSIIDYSTDLGVGNGASWLMMSYLNMYEATGDKAYLVKFINTSIKCLKRRQDVLSAFDPTFPPKWTLSPPDGGTEATYFNTLLLFPMVKFIYIVKNNVDLYNSNLSENIIDFEGINDTGFPDVTILGYGDYANWLGQRVEETMNYLDANYWDDTYGHTKFQNGTVAELNFQSLFATVYLYLYEMNTAFGPSALDHDDLYDKLLKLRYLYLFGEHLVCTCSFPNTCANEKVFEEQPDNTFHWGHQGWRPAVCNEDNYKEDITHGAMDLIFPMADWNLGTGFFTTTNFHNWAHETFTKNIYVNEFKFYNNVWGTDYDMDPDQVSTSYCTLTPFSANGSLNFFWGELLTWMPLEAFDNPGNSVYDALMLHTFKLKNATFTSYTDYPCRPTQTLSGAQSFVGLSEVVKAQWWHECVDLNMTNRDLIYDQDFYARGSIYIQPTYTSTSTVKAFAEPNNTIAPGDPDYFNKNEYIVESGVKSHMKAGHGIHLYPGFSAKAGCDFRAYIDTSICNGGASLDFRSFAITSTNETYTTKPIGLNALTIKPLVNLQANVDTDKNLVWLQSENTNDKNQGLIITDLTGRVIKSYDYLPASVNTNDMPPACYIFCYTTINGRASQKVFIR